MRIRLSVAIATLGLLIPCAVPAQPSAPPPLYVCTPSGQVLAVDGGTGSAAVVYTLEGASFDDCVLGPDGRLYISSGTELRRLTPRGSFPDAEVIATFPSAARGLGFNVTDLFVATAGSPVAQPRIFRVPGVSELPFGGGPVPTVPSSALAASGAGMAFDIEGHLIAGAGQQLQSFAPPYDSAGSPLWSASGSPVLFEPHGVAVDTCGQVVFADRRSRTIQRRSANGTVATVGGITFGSRDIPLYLEIDPANRLFIVTAESEEGGNAKVWRAVLPFATSPEAACSAPAASHTLLLSLRSSLNGPRQIPGLATSAARGIATGPASYSLTRTFTSAECSGVYNFGYHTLSIGFRDCGSLPADAPGYPLTVTAVKSRPSQVEFSGAFVPVTGTIEGMRYSPMGGYVVHYVLAPVSGAPAPSPFLAKYSFFTQEAIATPGVARAESHDPDAVFTDGVGTDYWDLTGLGFDPAGERANDFSKRVVYNASLRSAGVFTGFEEPFHTGNPLFKQGQTVKIGFRVVDGQGNPVSDGTLRVSIVRIDDPAFPVQDVTSVPQSNNTMASLGNGKYVYYLQTTGYAVGTYLLTIWGDVLPVTGPGSHEYTRKVFQITQ